MQKIDCRYDQDTGIFYKYYRGDIHLKELWASWDEIILNDLIPKGTKKFIFDYRKGMLIAAPQDAKDIACFYKKYNHIFAQSRVALIMQKPDQVIFPILVNQEHPNVYFRPFYHMEDAIDWLS